MKWTLLKSAVALGLWALSARGQDPAEAQALQRSGDLAGAERIWRQLVEREPSDYRLWASLGVALAGQNRFGEAAQAYRHALKLKPGDGTTELNLGITEFKAGRLAEAIPPLESAARSLGDPSRTDILLGMSLYGTGRFKEAATHLAQAASRDGQNEQLQRTLAQSYLYAGDYPAALNAFQALLRSNSDSPSVHMLLGEAYDGVNQGGKAIEEFRAAASAPGYLPNAHFGLGYLLWKDHKYGEAAAEFDRELKEDPQHNHALTYRGDTALKGGDKAGAKTRLEAALNRNNRNHLAALDLGIIASEANQSTLAEKYLKMAVAADPADTHAHYRLARLYKDTGRQADSRKELALTKTLLSKKTEDDLLVKVSGSPPAPASQSDK